MTATPATASAGAPLSRYSVVAIALHWIIAALMIANIGIAWYFNSLPHALRSPPTQLHKSIGITVLMLTLARIAWRFIGRPPPLPDTLRGWEKWGARISHFVFYGLMLGLPLTGWAMVSASPLIAVHPTVLFGVIPWPSFPFPGFDSDALHDAHKSLEVSHGLLAKLAYVTIAVHVLAALKHHFLDRDDVMARMIPFIAQRRGAGA
ncbi:MAG TPA: cytochrome b [Caulobacteraceae bacterium]|nr:cytochrome b [Caulobacteraceae bacterium]